MYGLIVSLSAKPGQRDALIAIMVEGANALPGCTSYIVAKDAADENKIWVTEIWDRKSSQQAALKLPAATELLRKMTLLADMSVEVTHEYTLPIGGVGLGR